MLLFKAKPGRGGVEEEGGDVDADCCSFRSLPVSGGLWGHADHHGELRTLFTLSAPPAVGIPPSLHLKAQASPQELLLLGELSLGCRQFLAPGKIPEQPQPGWEKGA